MIKQFFLKQVTKSKNTNTIQLYCSRLLRATLKVLGFIVIAQMSISICLSQSHRLEILGGFTFPMMNFGNTNISSPNSFFANGYGSVTVRYIQNNKSSWTAEEIPDIFLNRKLSLSRDNKMLQNLSMRKNYLKQRQQALNQESKLKVSFKSKYDSPKDSIVKNRQKRPGQLAKDKLVSNDTLNAKNIKNIKKTVQKAKKINVAIGKTTADYNFEIKNKKQNKTNTTSDTLKLQKQNTVTKIKKNKPRQIKKIKSNFTNVWALQNKHADPPVVFIEYTLSTYKLDPNIKSSITDNLKQQYEYTKDIDLNLTQNLWLEHSFNIGVQQNFRFKENAFSVYGLLSVGGAYLVSPQFTYNINQTSNSTPSEKSFTVSCSNIFGITANAAIGLSFRFKQIQILIEGTTHYFYGLQKSQYQIQGEYGSQSSKKVDIEILSIIPQIGISLPL